MKLATQSSASNVRFSAPNLRIGAQASRLLCTHGLLLESSDRAEKTQSPFHSALRIIHALPHIAWLS